MVSELGSNNSIIPIQKDKNIFYDKIIAIFGKQTVESNLYLKSKKIILLDDSNYIIRSYIYCEDDYLIATPLDLVTLKKKINLVINDKNKLFSF